MHRRTFLRGTLTGLATGMSVMATETAALPIIDTHQHLWDLSKFRLPWLKKEASLAKSFLMDDYLKASDGLNVVRSVYMEVDVEPSQQQAEAEYVIDICQRGNTPMKAAIISGRPESADFAAYAKQYKDSKYVKGVRRVLHGETTPSGTCLGADFIKGIRLLGELGLSFDLCMRAPELPDAGKLVDACPGTAFILDHCGNPDVKAKDHSQWQRDIDELAKKQNLSCKVSGIVASAVPGKWTVEDLAPIVNHVLDRFGPDRVVFGGDWPVCTLAATYRQWVEALKTIISSRPLDQQRKLLHENAQRVYRLG